MLARPHLRVLVSRAPGPEGSEPSAGDISRKLAHACTAAVALGSTG